MLNQRGAPFRPFVRERWSVSYLAVGPCAGSAPLRSPAKIPEGASNLRRGTHVVPCPVTVSWPDPCQHVRHRLARLKGTVRLCET
jgi:hypothetical protein